MEAALWPSRFKAREVARERLADFFALFFFPFLRSRAACLRIFFEPFFGTASFTPARRAFEVDIGNAIKPFYGAAAGDQLTALLKEHITTAVEIVAAAKAGDKAKQDDATKRWFANADAIADFLSKANPKNWPQAEMRAMMHDHLKLTTNEVVARLHGDWAGDVAAYDAVHEQILKMADILAMGIANQFPGKV